MLKKDSKRLVIDASIARACGGTTATFPTSKKCRDFLSAVIKICHRVVMSPEIRVEWDRHQSVFAQTWLKSMVAKRKLVAINVENETKLLERVTVTLSSEKSRKAVAKDIHLVVAALQTDHTIASLDETVRQLLKTAASDVTELKRLVWVNPDKDDEQLHNWLESGAKPESVRMLLGKKSRS